MATTKLKQRGKRKANRRFAEARLLECGHPGQPNNLIRGRCGTCICAKNWEKLSKESGDKKLQRLTGKLAEYFRVGKMVYDRNGKTLLEWEETLRPHSNVLTQPPRE